MCGNLGFLLVGEDAPAATEMLEMMGKVTSMRGAQSFGFVASAKSRMRVHKAVVRKRADIAMNLKKAYGAVMGRRKVSPVAVAAHLRFATSSKTTARDAHPHVWLQNVRCKVIRVNPQTQMFSTHSVSRAVAITHNGDFEAFDLGACFGDQSKCVDLAVLREWLAARLGAPPLSSGDSIMAAGLLELLFAAGDPYASVRLAFVGFEEGKLGIDPAPRDVIDAAAAAMSATLLNLGQQAANELSYSLNAGLQPETRSRQMTQVSEAVAVAFRSDVTVSNFLASRRSLVDSSRRVASAAVQAFFEADLRAATRRFLRRAHGSFGLVVSTSLAPCALVVASIKQPMAVGVGHGFVAYGSERAALHAGVVGERIVARRLLREGEVIWFAPSVQDNGLQLCACRMASATIHDAQQFRSLTFSAPDFDIVTRNKLIMPPIRASSFQGDVVGADLAATPSVLRRVRDSFRDADSPNSITATALASTLFPPPPATQERVLDLVIVGTECSLWVGEQWAANIRSAFPKLRVVIASANKVLASLTAVTNDATCGAQTPGYTVFPSGYSPAKSVQGAVALVISHSGQTFPSLNASRALKKAGAHVFAVAGSQDTVIASAVLDQSFAVGAPHSNRLFSTDAGIRLAEPASLTTVAIHVLLTEILYALAVDLSARGATIDECVLISTDLRDLRTLHDESIDNNVPALCRPTPSEQNYDDIEDPRSLRGGDRTHPYDEAVSLGRRWGNHVIEPFVTFLLAVAYVLATVTAGTPALGAIIRAVAHKDLDRPRVRYTVAFLDALLYAFFPVVAALALRVFQGRTLLARFGKRTALVLDVPQVHQCIVAYAQKLFGLSYGLNGIDISGFNPVDHSVHRCLHRVVRGTLVALGVPDGRLRALIDSECAAFLTASQIKSIENWGVGPELVTIGHHTYTPQMVDGAIVFDCFARPAFLSEVAHGTGSSDVALPPKRPMTPPSAKSSQRSLLAHMGGSFSKKQQRAVRQTSTSDARRIAFMEKPKNVGSSDDIIGGSGGISSKSFKKRPFGEVLASHTVVETLYEGRVATLERQLAFYVFFHAVAKRASTALWPFFSFDTWRSQAGTRVATTPSPTSPSADPLPQQAVRLERVTTFDDFQDRQGHHQVDASHYGLASLFHHHDADRRNYDMLATDDESEPGLDLSAHDASFLWNASPIPEFPTPDQAKPDDASLIDIVVTRDDDGANSVEEEA
ncbi:hypothetical protein CTAYLR_000400 [Chrysophaeum taylorii]|uniref:Glutamine amidotransferase type-2 domain-containing protein n=1 Tax=Chrysophaeum taylorii TaxID=2483200 RepID=A0AAD7XLW7_9STRA|nr:hypothetical protein CTAYLR_000400 [Chrysophaeum taylorii]